MAELSLQNSTISSRKTEHHPAERQHERRRKAASARRVLRAARSNLGGTDRIKADFRNLGEHLWQFSLPIELFLPHGSSRVPAQSSVQAVQRDVTSVSLQRIDRACYQD